VQTHVQSAKATREDASSSDARSDPDHNLAHANAKQPRFSISAGTAKVTSFAYQMHHARSNAGEKQAEPGTARETVDAQTELASNSV
jgi:hypothetical protein